MYVCRVCLEEFKKDEMDLHKTYCRPCEKARSKKYREANAEIIKLRNRQFYKENRKKISEQRKARRKSKEETMKKNGKFYCAKCLGEFTDESKMASGYTYCKSCRSEMNRKWQQENKEKRNRKTREKRKDNKAEVRIKNMLSRKLSAGISADSKRCYSRAGCGKVKKLTEFEIDETRADGHDYYCKACRATKPKRDKKAAKKQLERGFVHCRVCRNKLSEKNSMIISERNGKKYYDGTCDKCLASGKTKQTDGSEWVKARQEEMSKIYNELNEEGFTYRRGSGGSNSHETQGLHVGVGY